MKFLKIIPLIILLLVVLLLLINLLSTKHIKFNDNMAKQFIFNDYNISIEDNNGYIKELYMGRFNDMVTKIVGNKKFIYLEKGAILKTHIDSIDIQDKYIKTGGWMGVFYYKKGSFQVNKNGKFSLIDFSKNSSLQKPIIVNK